MQRIAAYSFNTMSRSLNKERNIKFKLRKDEQYETDLEKFVFKKFVHIDIPDLDMLLNQHMLF